MNANEPEVYSIDEAGRTLGVSAADIQSYVAEGLVEPRPGPAASAGSTAPRCGACGAS